ncbi:type II secretion system F family protein [Haliangium ochraceum]|uniref:Type II secretion system F domain protein n=1 Tax=Haliangium ochraceum (strain DSM 14365 / JCM 11303 / SMP-2) TaxID=502025 RepID=D0LSU4_HALO1|nr:type II secretion system F family protein [Haliangium ochraceum]ACY17316.1 Type II secretion system F domain protein [Haliangium ochraceum DSM 14365]
MPKFAWQGTDRNGAQKKGVMEAINEDAVANRLRAENITVNKVRAAGIGDFELKIGTGVSSRDLLIFTRQLATMIDAGLPLVQCLDILAGQAENKAFAKVLFSVKSGLESGASFSESLRKHPKVFDQLYINLVAAGEVGGILDTILLRLTAYIEKAVKLKRQVKGALTYPIGILVIALGVVAVMLGKVIPSFQEMYSSFEGAALPEPTQVVIGISESFRDLWFVWLGGVLAIAATVSWMNSSDRGRVLRDHMLLKIPLIGSMMRKIVVARFTRTLGTLLTSGVAILDALDICSRTAGNRVVQAAIEKVRQAVSEGKDLAAPLGASKVFPSMVVEMISVGEQTGTMDQMLQKIADFYEEEVDVAVAAMTKAIEPLLMGFLGVVVGGLLIAMYLPVFELAGSVNAG